MGVNICAYPGGCQTGPNHEPRIASHCGLCRAHYQRKLRSDGKDLGPPGLMHSEGVALTGSTKQASRALRGCVDTLGLPPPKGWRVLNGVGVIRLKRLDGSAEASVGTKSLSAWARYDWVNIGISDERGERRLTMTAKGRKAIAP